MTLLGLALLIQVLTFSAGFIAGRLGRSAEPLEDVEPPSTLAKIRGAIDFRVAVHEAGHAVLAWHNPYVRSIDRIEMDDGLQRGNGRMLHRVNGLSDPRRARWYDLTMLLAGIAGEMRELRNTRSGNAQDDLEKALAAARAIVRDGPAEPPWEGDRPEGGFDPSRMLRATPEEAVVIRIAYARTKAVLSRDRERFERIVHLLLEHGALGETEVVLVFGTRPRWR